MSSHQIQLTVNFKEAMILLVGIDETEWWLNALVVVFIYSSEKVGFFRKLIHIFSANLSLNQFSLIHPARSVVWLLLLLEKLLKLLNDAN